LNKPPKILCKDVKYDPVWAQIRKRQQEKSCLNILQPAPGYINRAEDVVLYIYWFWKAEFIRLHLEKNTLALMPPI